ncbi:MAG: hypothetical protein QME63_07755, partial [Actinomycetota bacterium]|nr:hypothetical protein [Actinomycetota bacterium]
GRGNIESSLPSREGNKNFFFQGRGIIKDLASPQRRGNIEGLKADRDRQKKNCHCEEAAKQEEAEKGAYRDEE